MIALIKKSWWMLAAMCLPLSSAFAEEAAHAGGVLAGSWSAPLGVGIGFGIAVVGAAAAQGRIAASFMEGVARNPGAQKTLFTPLIISLAFVETLVLFAFLVLGVTLSGKI
ncbi:MAG: hypothetical protein HY537_14680 [Deltaproteobacteria bacterium]|nr:hypothetical protein [Deltaproteobacteria bacterium]